MYFTIFLALCFMLLAMFSYPYFQKSRIIAKLFPVDPKRFTAKNRKTIFICSALMLVCQIALLILEHV